MCTAHERHQGPGLDQNAPQRSRRRRLWDLDHKCHCPVIGVCLSIDGLRKAVGKLYRQDQADDYAVHVAAVAQCATRSNIAELLQPLLEKRHALAVARFRHARSADAVYRLWREAVAEGSVAGALWAALTHAACDIELENLLCREIHMIQHQAGAQERCDRGALSQLQSENAVLARELGRVQERVNQLLADKAREQQLLEKRLMEERAQRVQRDSIIAFLQADLAELREGMPDLETRERLHERNLALTRQLEVRDTRLLALQREQAARPARVAAAPSEPAPPESIEPAAPPRLDNKTILCVGGRHGSVTRYRDIVEHGGGRFAHHDGGTEQRADVLDADLAAADLVICQAGCISHNAYWRVKDHCKRTGKQCVFLDNPSASSFTRGLRRIALAPAPVG